MKILSFKEKRSAALSNIDVTCDSIADSILSENMLSKEDISNKIKSHIYLLFTEISKGFNDELEENKERLIRKWQFLKSTNKNNEAKSIETAISDINFKIKKRNKIEALAKDFYEDNYLRTYVERHCGRDFMKKYYLEIEKNLSNKYQKI